MVNSRRKSHPHCSIVRFLTIAFSAVFVCMHIIGYNSLLVRYCIVTNEVERCTIIAWWLCNHREVKHYVRVQKVLKMMSRWKFMAFKLRQIHTPVMHQLHNILYCMQYSRSVLSLYKYMSTSYLVVYVHQLWTSLPQYVHIIYYWSKTVSYYTRKE